MYEEKKQDRQEIISMEEYLCRRQRIKEEAGRKMPQKEKSPVFILQNFLYSD